MSEAFVTLATNDDYVKGACVLGYSLRRSGTIRRLLVLVTTGVSPDGRERLLTVWDEIQVVYPLESDDPQHLKLFSRPELRMTFTKLKAWQLTQFKKCVFLNADTLVLCNVDELFDHPELSAAPDVGWPDCFNSGVFVFEPSQDTFQQLLQLAAEEGSFDGGDQGLLNRMWSDWSKSGPEHRLSFTYNVTTAASYTYQAAWQRFGQAVRILHFVGGTNPWHYSHLEFADGVLDSDVSSGQAMDFTRCWWKFYKNWQESLFKEATPNNKNARTPESTLPPSSSSPQGSSPPLSSGSGMSVSPTSHTPPATTNSPSLSPSAVVSAEYAETTRDRERWETGHVDYMGRDKFENIQAHLDKMVGKPSKPPF